MKKDKKEIVTLSNDSSSFTVDYFYNDKLFLETKPKPQNDIFQFKQIEDYKYNSGYKLKESSLK